MPANEVKVLFLFLDGRTEALKDTSMVATAQAPRDEFSPLRIGMAQGDSPVLISCLPWSLEWRGYLPTYLISKPQRGFQQQTRNFVPLAPSTLSLYLLMCADLGPLPSGQGDAECPVACPLFRTFLASLPHHL